MEILWIKMNVLIHGISTDNIVDFVPVAFYQALMNINVETYSLKLISLAIQNNHAHILLRIRIILENNIYGHDCVLTV